jgi:glycolate oxidase FAD binding subunit
MNGAHSFAETATLSECILAASQTGTALRIRGGGSKDFYGNPGLGRVIETRGLRGIVSYEPSELVVTVGAGTPLAELESTLAAQGQYLPFEPPHLGEPGVATVGGMVATGLSGPARAAAGSVRDHVLGVTMLNGRGQLLRFGGQVIKNVAGYDVSRVMAGAMGCLGLLVDVSLKVMPIPRAEATLAWDIGQADALAQLHRWGGQPLPLNASCWVKDETDGGRERLFVRLRGAVAAVEAACTRMLADRPANGACRLDSAQTQGDWRLCRDLQLPFFGAPPDPDAVLWRLSLPQTAPVLELPWPQCVEWQGAQRWLWAPLSAARRLRDLASQAGGYATIFRASNRDRSSQNQVFERFSPLAPPLDRIHRQLKAEFDPAGVFNRGRLYANL